MRHYRNVVFLVALLRIYALSRSSGHVPMVGALEVDPGVDARRLSEAYFLCDAVVERGDPATDSVGKVSRWRDDLLSMLPETVRIVS